MVYLRESDCDKTGFVEGFSENVNESTTKTPSTTITNKSDLNVSYMKFDDNFAGLKAYTTLKSLLYLLQM